MVWRIKERSWCCFSWKRRPSNCLLLLVFVVLYRSYQLFKLTLINANIVDNKLNSKQSKAKIQRNSISIQIKKERTERSFGIRSEIKIYLSSKIESINRVLLYLILNGFNLKSRNFSRILNCPMCSQPSSIFTLLLFVLISESNTLLFLSHLLEFFK